MSARRTSGSTRSSSRCPATRAIAPRACSCPRCGGSCGRSSRPALSRRRRGPRCRSETRRVSSGVRPIDSLRTRGWMPRGGNPMDNLIEVRDLVKHFPITQGIVFQKQVAAVRAVDGISFDVRRGETLGIVGETGCGKSTTAKLLLRLIDPTSGSITFEGDEIAYLRGAPLKRLRREMQMIFQDPYSSLNPRKTVGS